MVNLREYLQPQRQKHRMNTIIPFPSMASPHENEAQIALTVRIPARYLELLERLAEESGKSKPKYAAECLLSALKRGVIYPTRTVEEKSKSISGVNELPDAVPPTIKRRG